MSTMHEPAIRRAPAFMKLETQEVASPKWCRILVIKRLFSSTRDRYQRRNLLDNYMSNLICSTSTRKVSIGAVAHSRKICTEIHVPKDNKVTPKVKRVTYVTSIPVDVEPTRTRLHA